MKFDYFLLNNNTKLYVRLRVTCAKTKKLIKTRTTKRTSEKKSLHTVLYNNI